MLAIYSKLGLLKNKPNLNVKHWILSKGEKQKLKAELLTWIHNQSSFLFLLNKYHTHTLVSTHTHTLVSIRHFLSN